MQGWKNGSVEFVLANPFPPVNLLVRCCLVIEVSLAPLFTRAVISTEQVKQTDVKKKLTSDLYINQQWLQVTVRAGWKVEQWKRRGQRPNALINHEVRNPAPNHASSTQKSGPKPYIGRQGSRQETD